MQNEPFTLPAFAKINLHLEVIGKRIDGFHELCTVFQTISLADSISFFESDSINLTCDDASIPIDQRNLIIQAALRLREKFRINAGAKIHLEKNIPSPGGLGGGSSDAAVSLIGLARLWNIDVSFDGLRMICSELGSDLPFFLYGGTAIGTGRGTEISPIYDIDEKLLVIVTPGVSVSTAAAFAGLNAPNLTTDTPKRILYNCRFDGESFDLRRTALKNDFEATVFAKHPEIESVKNTLLELGAVNALMSGSGASVFAVFDKEETRQAAVKALDKYINWRTFAAATISRSEYREKLGLDL